LREVFRTLLETLLIVVIVIFLFLGRFRSVLVPVVAIPVSLIGAIFLMQVFGFTVNLLTLARDRAVGRPGRRRRHRRRRKRRDGACAKAIPPVQAAVLGARELLGPIIAMTITLAAVYAPIGLQGGLTGSLFREFAFTLAGAVMISGVVALTLSPVMSSKLLTAEGENKGFTGHINRNFDRLRNLYGRALDTTLSARPAVYVFWIVMTLLCFPMFKMSSRELAPTEDQGVIFGIMEAPSNATIDETARYAQEVTKEFMSVPETAYTFQLTFPTTGFGGAVLKPWSERERTAFEIMPEVSQKSHQDRRISMFPVMPPALPGGGQFPVEVVIAATVEPQQIMEIATKLQQTAAASGSSRSPRSSTRSSTSPRSEIVIDRDKVGRAGIEPRGGGRRRLAAMWAATSSTASTSRGAATRSSRRCSAPRGLNAAQLQNST
jgi:multidrug efflux pump